MKKVLGAALLALSAMVPAADAWSQAAPRNTLVVLREIDADSYDPHKDGPLFIEAEKPGETDGARSLPRA